MVPGSIPGGGGSFFNKSKDNKITSCFSVGLYFTSYNPTEKWLQYHRIVLKDSKGLGNPSIPSSSSPTQETSGMLKTQNLCCHREGRVNTKWKLVRRPGREMGSVSISLPLLEWSNSWTAKSNCWGWAAPENKLMVFRVLRSIYDFGRDIYLSRSSHQRTHYYERIVGESYYIKALSTLRVPTIGVFITSLDLKNFTSWNYEKKNNAWNIKR